MNTQYEEKLLQLGIARETNRKKLLRAAVAVAVLLIISGIGFYLFQGGNDQAGMMYNTDPVTRVDLAVTVSATGTIEPTDQVKVSSELSGIVDAVFVDYNDHVSKGQVLARLNTSILSATVLTRKSSLRAAQATVLQNQAAVEEAELEYNHYRQVWELSGGKVPSRQVLDSARIAVAKAKANLSSAEASVDVARANLESAESDLIKAEIVSPIDGVVLSRDIEPGQTVASSLSAPTLFLLARDLTDMELHVDIDEADIGLIKLGQKATFTVDAYSGREFGGEIVQIRLASTEETESTVVSYETVLSVPNKELLLLPGMTAITDIAVESTPQALTIANAALRYRPLLPDATTSGSGNEAARENRGGFLNSLMPGPRRLPGGSGRRGNNNGKTESETGVKGSLKGRSATVWVLRNEHPVPVEIETGISDGVRTQVVSGDLREGDRVITDAVQVKK